MNRQTDIHSPATQKAASARLLSAVCALFLVFFAVSCVERPAPDQVTAAYFEAVAQGDMFALRPFLTPDGQEILDQMAAVPELRAAMESGREAQKQFWTGVVRSVSQPVIEGSRAVVDFIAEVPGRGKASCPIVLFLIDGEWKISSTSVSGLQADRFRNELMALKAPPAAPAPAEKAESVPEKRMSLPRRETEPGTPGSAEVPQYRRRLSEFE